MAECRGWGGMRVSLWMLILLVVDSIAPKDLVDLPLPDNDFQNAMKSPTGKEFLPGRYGGKFYPPPSSDTTTRLPEFLPDGPRPFIPDPSFMPGINDVIVHQGEMAILPCAVQNLGTRQVSWNKVGGEHFLSIGTEVWVQDANLEIFHYAWPAGVGDWNLVFREARLQDSGLYQCQIISTEKLTWQVRLTVIEKPPHNPVISIEGKEFVESGQTVYLRCNTTEGDRIPDDVDWFKDGDKIDAKSYPNVVITKFRKKDTMALVSELIIASGSSNDSGTYICRSSSELIASLEVNVLVADSSNVKRGTGASHTQPGTGFNAGNTCFRHYVHYSSSNLLFLGLLVFSLTVVNNWIT